MTIEEMKKLRERISERLNKNDLPYSDKNKIPKITISTTDINYIDYLIHKGRISEAKQVLLNLKSTANIIHSLICDTEDYLINLEEK